eukprot:974269-Rhodomonas_salina.3
MGVQLNEEADLEANKGLLSQIFRPVLRASSQRLLLQVDTAGSPIADFVTYSRKCTSLSCVDSMLADGGLTTESYLCDGRGQNHLHSTRQSLPEKLQCSMLQLLGGVFPCGLRSYHIGKSASAACKLCGKMETPSHILCHCSVLRDIITASHDKIW